MSRTQTVMNEPGLPLLLRIIYFLLFGWWFTGIWINVAWLLNLTILGLPLGVWMLDRVPQVLTLKPMKVVVVSGGQGNRSVVYTRGLPQRSFLGRALYFVLIGWWLSLIWANLAWVISLTIIGLPLGIWMFNRLPAVTSLMRT